MASAAIASTSSRGITCTSKRVCRAYSAKLARPVRSHHLSYEPGWKSCHFSILQACEPWTTNRYFIGVKIMVRLPILQALNARACKFSVALMLQMKEPIAFWMLSACELGAWLLVAFAPFTRMTKRERPCHPEASRERWRTSWSSSCTARRYRPSQP